MADGTSVASAGLVPFKTSRPERRRIGAVTPERQHVARLKRMRRTVLNSTRCLLRQRRGFRDKWKMVTFTYAEGVKWSPKHISETLARIKKWMQRRNWHYAYVWVLELTKRGVPHYHALIRIPYRAYLPQADKLGWWQHGMTNTATAKNAVGYLAKYASKGGDKSDYPKGARIHGAAGLTAESRLFVSFWNLPVWAREQLSEIMKTRRIRGGFLVLVTGEFLPTPYEVKIEGGVPVIYMKETKQ